MAIKTHSSAHASLFQSLVEKVTETIEGRRGASLATTPETAQSGRRRTAQHPTLSVANRIIAHHLAGEPAPEEAPEDLRAQHGGVVDTLWTCAKLSAEILAAKFAGNEQKATEKIDELKFSTCDPAWVEAITDYLEYFGPEGDRKKIPYIVYQNLDDFVLETLPANAKIALVGDWGTGTAEADELLAALARHEPDVVIHLGDIYYAGTESETHQFFLDPLDQGLARGEKAIPVYTLTGNHDMYSGGCGYYALLPKLNPPPVDPAAAQPASYFALRSPDGAWQLLVMDTGLHDHDPFTVSDDLTYLEATEEAWHLDKIARFSAQGGRTILLSHHQLFSAFELIGGKSAHKAPGEEAANPKLLASFRKFQAAAGRPEAIAAWFWGHEHNLCVYEPTLGLSKGRCIGHGAIPVFKDQNPYEVVASLPNPPKLVADPRNPGQPLQLGTVDDAYAHGFVILTLDDRTLSATATYFDQTDYSRPMFIERL